MEIILVFACNYCSYLLIGFFKGTVTRKSINLDYSIRHAFSFNNNFVFWIMLIIGTLAMGKLCFKIFFAFKNNNIGHKGTQRWATTDEIKEQYTAVPIKTYEYDAKPGFPICRIDNTYYIDDSPVNNMILGMTRSGKGETLIFPMIDLYSRSKHKPSMVITDPKLELYLSAKKTLEQRDYITYLVNIGDPVRGAGYNPLSLIISYYKAGEYGTAQMLCKTFAHTIFSTVKNPTKDEFFTDTAISLMCALIWAHMEDCIDKDNEINRQRKQEYAEEGEKFIPIYENTRKITLYSIVNLFVTLANESMSGDKSVLDAYFNNRPAGNKAKFFFAASGIAGDRTKGSIYATAFSKIEIFSMEKNAKMMAENSIDFVDVGFGDKPVAIFVGIPDIDKSNHALATTFISQLYFAISDKAIKSRGGKCKREVHFILDEFGNMPMFSDMDSYTTVCLGRNIRFNFFLQAYTQMETLYGKEMANTIIGNCGNQVYILTDDSPSAETYSKLLGNKTVKIATKTSKPGSLEVTYNEHFDERPLINPAELMNLTEGEYIVFRVMKRKDKKGNDITSYPIFNTKETKAIPRYKYMLDDFPQGNILDDVGIEDRSQINIKARMVDAGEWIDKIKYGTLIDFVLEEVFIINQALALDHSEVLRKLNPRYSLDRDFYSLTLKEYLSLIRKIYEYQFLSTEQYQRLHEEVIAMANEYKKKFSS